MKEKPKPREYFVIEQEVRNIGSAAIPILISLFNDDNAKVRHAAINCFLYMRDSRALLPLIKILENEQNDSNDRTSAAQALADISYKEAYEALVVALQ